MIIWLNGAFGAGKTTAAQETLDLLPGSALFDPELVGSGLRTMLPKERLAQVDDFQDLPSWRRLVVDTGLHAKGWTRDQGVRFFVEVNGSNPLEVASEVDRYCSWPGQACGYKMGHNEINRLRTRAQAALGARYDLKAFDDVVVGTGNVPLTLLERVVDRYVAGAQG